MKMFPQVEYSYKPEFFSSFTSSEDIKCFPSRVKFNAIPMNHGEPTVKNMQSIIKDIKTRNKKINENRERTF